MKPLMGSFEDRDIDVYMDNAATTVVSEEVLAEMTPYLEERYGNPDTHYHLGREAAEAVDEARERVAAMAGCEPDEVFFTSGGTEANNWALKGLQLNGCIVAGSTEHVSVLEPLKWDAMRNPEKRTFSLLSVDADGVVKLDELKSELENKDVEMVSVQFANNETGTIQPIAEIVQLCRESGVIFHSDAVQAAGKVQFDMEDEGIDLLTLSAHKIHGPMGVGALCIRKGVEIDPLIHGGGHQNGRRSGTLPVAHIVGFGKAAELAISWKKEMERLSSLRKSMATSLKERMGAVINGGENVLPTILSFTVPNTEASAVCGVLCERHGLCISTGAACSRGKPSHVLQAMGVSAANCASSFRVSLSVLTSKNDCVIAADKIQAAIRGAVEREML